MHRSVLGGATNINIEMLVTPEGSLPHFEVNQTYMPQCTTLIILDFFQVVILVLLAVSMSQIQYKHVLGIFFLGRLICIIVTQFELSNKYH